MPRHRISALLALLLLPGSAVADSPDPWPAFRGHDGTGRALRGLPPGDDPLALEVRWQRELGSGYSGVSVARDVVVTAAASGEVEHVVAFDRETGEERWRAELGPVYRGHDGSHDGPISTPALADGRVFILGPWGDLAAFDLADGTPLWRRHAVEELGSEKPYYGYGSSPRVFGDVVVVQIGGADGSVAGFDAATGELRWRAVEDEIGTQSPILAELGGRGQAVVLGARLVAGLDPADGTVLWSFEHGGNRWAQGNPTSSPMPLEGNRLFLKHDGTVSAVLALAAAGAPGSDAPAVAVEATTKGMVRSYSPPTLWDGVVFGYTARFLSAADAATGELLWRSREPGDGFLAAVGGQLAVLTKKGTLHLGPASRDGWTETARVELFDDLAWTPPSVAGSSLFVRSLGGIARVDLVRAEAPAELPTVEIPGQLRALVEELGALEEGQDAAAVVEAFLEDAEAPLVDGREVVFLWRGEAEDVAIAGEMIGMRREEPMHRIEGTDLWWWATELDPRARVSYVFLVDGEPALDPSHRRQVPSTILGPDMNWQRGDRLEMSWLAMPEWPGHPRLAPLEVEVETPGREEGETVEQTVAMRVWTPPGYEQGTDRYPVVYVHRGDAVEVGDWPAALESAVGRTVAPLIVVFVDSPSIWAYREVFAAQVVPRVDERYRTLADREHRANVAMGWPGAMATAMTFAEPGTFGVLGVQSLMSLDETYGAIVTALGDGNAEAFPLRIYLEWGRWDLVSPHEGMNFREDSRRVWNLIRERGWTPMGGEVWDSTDWGSWRNRTAVLLESLFPLEGGGPSPRLEAWQTVATED